VAKLPNETVIDGEIVAFDAGGRPSFNALQNAASAGTLTVYYVFDLMVLAGRDLRGETLAVRSQLPESCVRGFGSGFELAWRVGADRENALGVLPGASRRGSCLLLPTCRYGQLHASSVPQPRYSIGLESELTRIARSRPVHSAAPMLPERLRDTPVVSVSPFLCALSNRFVILGRNGGP
jgi:hypothetical protein